MLRISCSLFIVLFSIHSFASYSKDYSLQTWSCSKNNTLLNPKFKNLKAVRIIEAEIQRTVELKICNLDQSCEVLTYVLNDWKQTSSKLTGWSLDTVLQYYFNFEFNLRGEAKIEIYSTYIHFDGEDVCEGIFGK